MEFAPNIHIIPGITAHAYLLEDPDGLTLIDTGIPGSAKAILRYMKRAGYSPRDLNRILLTHADYDHAGSLAALKKATGARVYASVSEARALAGGHFPRSLKTDEIILKPLFWLAENLGRISPAHVDEHLSDGQVLPVLGGLRALDTRGHTPGHISFFAPARGILFSGDSILSKNNTLVGSQGAVTWDQIQADASMIRQLSLNARIICSGHGSVLMDILGRLFPVHKEYCFAPSRLIP